MSEPPGETDTLQSALERHDIAVDAPQRAQLDRYAHLLWEWNGRLNLTRHTDYEKFVARDVRDSLELARLIEPGERVLDVGTGGGVPGVVLAILRSDVDVTLCDSVAKRAKAAGEIVTAMDLPLTVYHAPVQDLLVEHSYTTLVARAVAPLRKLLTWLRPLWPHAGRLLVVKGPKWIEERGEARHHGLLKRLELRKVAAYPLSGTDSESVILEIRPIAKK